MKRVTAVKIIDEAARIFDVQASDLFCGKLGVEAVEAAVRYSFWLVGVTPPQTGKWLGEGGNAEAVKVCVAARGANADYDRKCGALVWFAQTGMKEA